MIALACCIVLALLNVVQAVIVYLLLKENTEQQNALQMRQAVYLGLFNGGQAEIEKMKEAK